MTNNIRKENIDDVYPMSDIQLGMVYHSLKAPGTPIYYNQVVFQRKDRDFKPDIFKKAMLLMVEKHPILRTVFNLDNARGPLQIVLKTIRTDIEHNDISNMDKVEQETHINFFLSEDRKKPFNLTIPGPLWKVRTFSIGKGEICFVWICHHAITDGWSTASLLTELNNTYLRLKSNPHYIPQKLKSTYKQFILEQYLEKKNKKSIQYWQNELAGYKRLTFPGGTEGKGKISRQMKYSKDLGEQLRQKLESTAQKYNTSFKNLCFASYLYMLNMLSYDGEIVAGLITHNRPVCEDGDKIIGCFLNTVPVRIKITHPLRWSQYIELVDRKLAELANYNTIPLSEIVKIIGWENEKQNPILDTFFNYIDFHVYRQINPLEENNRENDENLLSINGHEETNTSFNMDVTAFSGSFSIIFTYSPALISQQLVQGLSRYFEAVLNMFLLAPEKIINKEDLMTDRERQELLYKLNKTEVEYPRTTIHELFKEQTEKTPANTALVGHSLGNGAERPQDNCAITYKELNRKSDQLLHLFLQKGIQPGTIVAVMVERSLEVVTAILAILKAGAAYLPIADEYPRKRIKYMLLDSNASLVLTQKDFIHNFEKEMDTIHLDSKEIYKTDGGFAAHPPIVNDPQYVIYIIYTSGTTGKPKGAIIEHKGVVNYLKWAQQVYLADKKYDFPLYSSLSFDLTVTCLYLPLISGNKLYIYKEDEDELLISKVIRENKVQVIKLTPTHLKIIKDIDGGANNIRCLIVGGEELSTRLARDIYNKFNKDIEIFNEYGPTETVVGCMIYKYDDDNAHRISVPIGRAINNTGVYILDRNQHLLPANIAGELHISGEGVARGYLNRQPLTQQKFKPDPFVKGRRMYQSGDMARLMSDGNIEFLGRIDQQVKIRGYRIDLGEIESWLLQVEMVKEAVVQIRGEGDNNKFLTAYLLADEEPAVEELRAYLKEILPEYMVPSYFVYLQQLPLTPNGKIDRKALNSYDVNVRMGTEYVAPETDMEKTIAGIWQEVLDTDRVGVDDNFFDIGGHSLSIVKVSTKLKSVFKKKVSVATMFRYPTIRSLVGYFSQDGTSKLSSSTEERINESVKRMDEAKDVLTGELKKKQKRDSQGDMTKKESEGVSTGNEIAVIGMAGRFPGARDIHEFWGNLKNGVESISFFSDSELEEAGVEPALLNNPAYVKSRGLLEQKEYFDAAFFGYTPLEAQVMNPQMCILHECTWEVLEDAGYEPGLYDGLIGFYSGASSSSIWEALSHFSNKSCEIGEYAALHLTDKDFINAKISYTLNLKGPVISIQTACSTSLVAIHLACRGLVTGECQMAIAGGIGIGTLRKEGYLYSEGMIFSPDGHCRAFDAKAKGTIGGEGGGLVVLKRLKDAFCDRDHIYAVIKGSAINNDGRGKVGFTAPSVEAQVEVIQTAQRIARIEPGSISYVEAHGTGTPLGDTVEVEALKFAFKSEEIGPCAIGSVKTNIGHLDSAAGIAGVIKTVLALKYRQIPPTLHFKAPNPDIDFDKSPFYVNTKLKEWRCDGGTLRASVTSLGIGGTNAHIVLEEAPTREDYAGSRSYQLMLLSAMTKSALDKVQTNLLDYLKKNKENNLTNIAYTLQVGRKAFSHRKTVVCSDVNEAIEALSAADSEKIHTFFSQQDKKKVVFMFPGQGTQYINMGMNLYEKEAVFREEMDRCFEILNPLMAYDLKDILYPRDSTSSANVKDAPRKIDQTELAQPLLFSIEYALSKLLMSWGILPWAMIGHSIGEYVAACLAGVFLPEDTLKLVALRGKLMQQMPPGAMLSVSISEKALAPFLPPGISMAAVNSPCLCVVSGSHTAIESFEKQLKKKGYKCRWLHTSHAFHSHMMEPILEPFEKGVRQIILNKPGIPYISNVTGQWISANDAVNPANWARHLRTTVRFAEGLETLLEDENVVFIEVGPGKMLSTFLYQHDNKREKQMAVSTMRHPREKIADDRYLLNKVGQLWLYGVNIDWNGFYGDKKEKPYRISLPTYPFERQRYWIEGDPLKALGVSPGKPSMKRKENIVDWLYEPSWTRSSPMTLKEDDVTLQSRLLVFMDDLGFGRRLLKHVAQYADHPPVIVISGREFSRINDCEYAIDPHKPDHYHWLFKWLQNSRKMPFTIIHLWNITDIPNEELTGQWIESLQYQGFYSLIYLARAVAKSILPQNTRLMVVANHILDINGEEPLSPAKATLMGPAKVIQQEYPNISCCCVDIVLPGPHSSQERALCHNLLSEITANSKESVIAYRGSYRWVQTFKPLSQLLHFYSNKTKEKQLPLKEKGIYLITGGMGNIGLVLAEFLARTVHARLVLVGRSNFPDRAQWEQWQDKNDPISKKIRRLQEIEFLGAKVLVKSANAADEEQMLAVIRETEKIFGPINGVFHAAGIVGEQCIRAVNDVDVTDWEKHALPKIYGVIVLDKVFRYKKLDFCLLMSSLSSVLGGLGFASYAAANIFMDSYVLWRKQKEKGHIPWMSINWDGWHFGEEEHTGEHSNVRDTGFALTAHEGTEVLKHILSLDNIPQLIISTGDLDTRINNWIKLDSLPGESCDKQEESYPPPGRGRPQMLKPYIAPQNRLEQQVARVWQQFFGLDKVGILDDFFELGGDSLKAMTVVSKIHKELKVELPLTEFFTRPTIKKLAEYIGSVEKKSYFFIEPAEKKEYYALSSAQKRLYILHNLDPESVAYNQPYVYQLQGVDIKLKFLDDTLKKIVCRHEMLRTSFELVNDKPVQKISEDVLVASEFYEVAGEYRNSGPGNITKTVEECIGSFVKPFDLIEAPIFRVGLIKISKGKYIFLLDIHHIVSDGSGNSTFINELMAFYNNERNLPALKLQYKDFSGWQNKLSNSGELKKQEEYWINRFKGDIPILNFPTDYPRPRIKSNEGSKLQFDLSRELTVKIRALTIETETTLYMVLLAAYNILLAKYTQQDEITVGSPVTGRNHADLQNIIGTFANMLAMKNHPTEEKKFSAFLMEIKENALKAYENQDYQFEELIVKLGLNTDFSRSPLFDVALNVLNIEQETENHYHQENNGLTFKAYDFEYKSSKYDLLLRVMDEPDRINMTLEYPTCLFRKTTIENIVKHYNEILNQIVKDTDIKIKDITINFLLLKNTLSEEDVEFNF